MGPVDPETVAAHLYPPRRTPATLAGSADSEVSPLPVGSPVLIHLSDIAAEPIKWLWPGRIPCGKLTLLIGDPGLGKSLLTLDMVARVSRAGAWPDGGRAPLGHVILLSAEDGVADTIRPRVDTLGGNAARAWVLSAVKHENAERPFSLAADLPALEQAMAQTGAVLVVIDPLSAYLGENDSYKDSEVRGLLAPLATLAEQTGIAVLGVMHLGKDAQRRAIHRALGSVAFVAAARVVLAVAKDPDNESHRLLLPIKNNLTAPPAVLAFSLPGGRLEWEPQPVAGVDADTILGQVPEDREERRDADEFLRELLKDGGVRAADVLRAARENGIPERTLYRAKRRLGIKARHEGQPGKRGAWYWFLPMIWPPNTATEPPKTATRREVAAFGEPSGKTDELAATSPKTATLRGGGSLREEEVDPWAES